MRSNAFLCLLSFLGRINGQVAVMCSCCSCTDWARNASLMNSSSGPLHVDNGYPKRVIIIQQGKQYLSILPALNLICNYLLRNVPGPTNVFYSRTATISAHKDILRASISRRLFICRDPQQCVISPNGMATISACNRHLLTLQVRLTDLPVRDGHHQSPSLVQSSPANLNSRRGLNTSVAHTEFRFREHSCKWKGNQGHPSPLVLLPPLHVGLVPTDLAFRLVFN